MQNIPYSEGNRQTGELQWQPTFPVYLIHVLYFLPLICPWVLTKKWVIPKIIAVIYHELKAFLTTDCRLLYSQHQLFNIKVSDDEWYQLQMYQLSISPLSKSAYYSK